MDNISTLQNMERPELCQLWKQYFKVQSPPKIGLQLLRHILAFEIQRQTSRDIDKNTYKKLQKLQSANCHSLASPTPQLKVGTRIMREWNGTTHFVDVTEQGFLWQKHHYTSLSAIAKKITGTHWSGPRFFGLKGKYHDA